VAAAGESLYVLDRDLRRIAHVVMDYRETKLVRIERNSLE
jgi:hypothetical protein